jgi:hypothetical protein
LRRQGGFAYARQGRAGYLKNLHLPQKNLKKFIEKVKKRLDIHGCVYYNGYRCGAGISCAQNCDDAGDCVEKR